MEPKAIFFSARSAHNRLPFPFSALLLASIFTRSNDRDSLQYLHRGTVKMANANRECYTLKNLSRGHLLNGDAFSPAAILLQIIPIFFFFFDYSFFFPLLPPPPGNIVKFEGFVWRSGAFFNRRQRGDYSYLPRDFFFFFEPLSRVQRVSDFNRNRDRETNCRILQIA